MKKFILCAALAACLLFTSCSTVIGTANIEELLRAPQTNATQSAVQTALAEYLDETPTLKYPRGGDEMSPVIIKDFDNDGTNEAAVLYITDSKGQNVHLAMLEPQDGGAWEVVFETEGMSTEVASVETVHLQKGSLEIIVGYANATLSDKYLTVYTYSDETITRMYDQSYTSYITSDLLGAGTQQLVVVPPAAQTGALSMLFLNAADNQMILLQTKELDERFVSCTGLYASQSGQSKGVVFDGNFSSGGLSSQIFKMISDKLVLWPQDDELDVPQTTLRYLTSLVATDFKGSKTYEVPTQVESFTTLTSTKRFYFVTWKNYLSDADISRFGVYDATNGYFVRLPADWKDGVTVTDGAQAGSWQVRKADGNDILLSVRIAESAPVSGFYTAAASLGDKSVLIYTGTDCTLAESALIRTGVTVIQ